MRSRLARGARRLARRFTAALALLCVALPAGAHTRSQSHSVWEINGEQVVPVRFDRTSMSG